jgi:hypothetical protein
MPPVIRRPASLLLVTALALAGLAGVASAAGQNISVLDVLGSNVAKVKAKTTVPVRVPSTLRVYFSRSKIFPIKPTASTNSYTMEIGIGRHCNGANVCYIAGFYAQRGAKPAFKRKVGLTQHRTGYFKPLTCGASCSPPELEWIQRGVLYSVAYKGSDQAHEKSYLVSLANGAIKAGPR